MLSLILLLLLLCPALVQSQTADLPTGYFHSPLRLPWSVSGSFAEIRSNHYHSGIDLRVGGRIGEPVYAAAEGHVSRIAISPWGGGKVLYIDHPNGYRTVYMHLNDFVGPIARYVRKYQYDHHTYSLDIPVPRGALPVSDGQLVAHAGNSGSSGGPHLHFEIRYAHNDQTINPFYFGFPYSDTEPPVIRGVRLYPQGASPINVGSDTIEVSSPFYTGVYATDLCQPGSGKNFPELIELYLDGALFFRYCCQSFLFEETRSVNALIDYPHYLATGRHYLLTRTLPGLNAPAHQPLRDQGWIAFSDTRTHILEYRVSDYKGHTVSQHFYVRGASVAAPPRPSALLGHHSSRPLLHYFSDNHFSTPDFSITVPEGALYDEDSLLYAATPPASGSLSPCHTFRPAVLDLPPHRPCTVRLRVPTLADTSRLVVVVQSGSKVTALPTTRHGSWLEARTRSWGSFSIMRDSQPPAVSPVGFSSGRRLKGTTLRLRLSDDLSGIDTYSCVLNGQWILAEFDGKTATLTIDASHALRPGANTLAVRVSDAAGNAVERSYQILH